MPDPRIEELLRASPINAAPFDRSPSLPAATPLGDVVATMQRRRAAAVVLTEDERVSGIFTERDLLNKIVGMGQQDHRPIREVMTPQPRTLSPDDKLADAIRLMTERGYRNIPLVDAVGRHVGMIAARDIMEFLAAQFPQQITRPPAMRPRPESGAGA
jgi:CBS domain-containing protein